MSNNKTRESGVIAVVQEESRLKAVELCKQGRAFELLWTKSGEASQMNLQTFVAPMLSCESKNGGLSAGLRAKTDKGRDKIAVVGFDSAGVVFYRISVPAVREEEVAAMVRLQAESRLPLPAEQMEVVWRTGRVQDGQMSVTVAAARREQLQGFVENVRGFEPAKILLHGEGIVEAWRMFFSGNDEQAVVVSMGERNTQVCLAECGRLINAVSLDVGMKDFSTAGGLAEQTETAERFAQDIESVLEWFGCAEGPQPPKNAAGNPEPRVTPVFVLSGGDRVIESIVSCLVSAGLNVRTALPEIQKLRAGTEFSAEEVYEYRVPIGLASMALEARAEELNIFERLYNPAEKELKKRWFYSPKVTGAIAVVMLALLVTVLYVVDVAGEKRWKGSEAEKNCNLLVQRHKLIRTVALQRPDLLGLLNEINSGESNGVMLDSFYFKKGQPVSISGQAEKAEQLYKFEKNLQDRKFIKDVKMTYNKEPKGDKLKFTLTFNYKRFTEKKNRAQI